MTIEQIKSRIERARKEENWNDFDWALSSLEVAVEALDEIERLACSTNVYRARNALAKIKGELGGGV